MIDRLVALFLDYINEIWVHNFQITIKQQLREEHNLLIHW